LAARIQIGAADVLSLIKQFFSFIAKARILLNGSFRFSLISNQFLDCLILHTIPNLSPIGKPGSHGHEVPYGFGDRCSYLHKFYAAELISRVPFLSNELGAQYAVRTF
jgi:hypothetical protein